jgi:hypothetical protein
MEYCSYEEAFPQLGPSSTGCDDQKASYAARKEERKKAKKCKGPPLTFLDLDPDRPAVQRVPAVPPMNEMTGLREHAPVDAPQKEPFEDVPYDLTSQRQPNDAGQIARNTLPSVRGQTQLPKQSAVPSYFGASGDMDEGFQGTFGMNKPNLKVVGQNPPFTDVIGNDDGYRLYPDFKAAFDRVSGVSQAAGKSLGAIPSVVNEWKPLTPSGARTSFFDELPPPGGQYPSRTDIVHDGSTITKKLDSLFSRLDDLESRRGENTQTEILLFVMTGLVVLFGMDIVTRQAARVRLI